MKATAGGGPHLTAVLAGKAEFTASRGTYQLNALNSGKRAIGFVDLLRRNIIGMVIHKDAAKKAGIKDGMPLMEKVKRAKGLKVGVTRPGALTDVLARNLLGRAMMKVPADVRILAVGGRRTMLPAFKNRKIDIFTISTPHPERMLSQGLGIWFVNWAGRRGQGHQGVHDDGRHGHAQAHEGAPSPRQADGRARHEVPEIHPENVHRAAHQGHDAVFRQGASTPEALRISVATVKGAVNPTGKMTDEAVQTTFNIMKSGGKLKNLKSVKRSDVWTDEFLK